MKTGVIVMNFGEPAEPTMEEVVPFLERIFFQNGGLERGDPEARRRRSRELAEARAPGLIHEYEEIGGSPLNEQADHQAADVERTLRDRGHDVRVYSAYQYTRPFIEAQVERARADGCERLVGLPVYPLCGHSTTVLALDELAEAVATLAWDVEVHEISGWHLHPDFLPMWIEHVNRFVYDEEVDLHDEGTALLFSIHGTPIKYLEAGNRYDRYVNEACETIAQGLGVARYHMGYQNHTNRPIAWTQPDVEKVVQALGTAGDGPESSAAPGGRARRVVVVPVAFMHEQSETLAELDDELREEAEAAGLDFHRVPVPHDDERFISMLADLVESRLGAEPASGMEVEWRQCVCRGAGGRARCTNGLRLSSTVEVVQPDEARVAG